MREPETILFEKDEVIFHEGEEQNFAYIIVSGNIDVKIKMQDGLKTIATVGANSLLGEMALMDGEPRSATAVAVEDVVCYKINQHHVDRIYGDKNSVARKLFQIQNQRIRNLNEQLKQAVIH